MSKSESTKHYVCSEGNPEYNGPSSREGTRSFRCRHHDSTTERHPSCSYDSKQILDQFDTPNKQRTYFLLNTWKCHELEIAKKIKSNEILCKVFVFCFKHMFRNQKL
jgi:hypothetical protein